MEKYDNDALIHIKGKTVESIIGKPGDKAIQLNMSGGGQLLMNHSQDCCEHVRLEEVIGDLDDLVGSPITEAEAVDSSDAPEPEYADSYTWTFYKLGTRKGSVTLRWLGESNGYYSESVDVTYSE